MALTEGFHAGEFLVSEDNGRRSRDVVTLVSGQVVAAGQVLGKITSGGKYAARDDDSSDGSEVALAVSYANYDATAGDMDVTIIARDAEVNANELTWAAADDAGDITEGIAELAAVGIIVRTAI